MKKNQKAIFGIFFLLYAVGILVGAMREISAPKQAEIYEYLGSSLSEYEVGIKSGIKNVANENIICALLVIVGGFFKSLFWIADIAVLIKGYLTGFSVMAALRLYGIKGIMLCGGNIISAGIMIPTISYFCSVSVSELFIFGTEKKDYYKKISIITFFLIAIFCVDCFLKGFLTPIFMKLASKLLI